MAARISIKEIDDFMTRLSSIPKEVNVHKNIFDESEGDDFMACLNSTPKQDSFSQQKNIFDENEENLLNISPISFEEDLGDISFVSFDGYV